MVILGKLSSDRYRIVHEIIFIWISDYIRDSFHFYFVQANSNSWQNMRQVWGVDWALNSADPLQAPFSLRLTTLSGKKRVTANNVIPKNWQPNGDYKSKTQMVSVDLTSDLSHSLEFWANIVISMEYLLYWI